MRNFDCCEYTYRHRKMFVYVVHKLIQDEALKEELLRRAKVHDMDKELMYMFCEKWDTINYHIAHRPHHLESGLGSCYEDFVETVIDYECAPYTKPDKPLNAYDFVHKLLDMELITKEIGDKLFGIMKEFGIDRSYDVTKEDVEGMAFAESLGEVTEEQILLEVIEYAASNPPELPEVISYIKEKGEE